MSRYTPYAGKRYGPDGWKTYTCSHCKSQKRLFVQCVPCLLTFFHCWGIDKQPLQEIFHEEEVPGAQPFGAEQHETSRRCSEVEEAKTVLMSRLSVSSQERWWSM